VLKNDALKSAHRVKVRQNKSKLILKLPNWLLASEKGLNVSTVGKASAL